MEESPKNDVDTELDWVKLRAELDEMNEQDLISLPYKDNWYVKTGLGLTAISYAYSLFNVNHTSKMFRGMSYRILCQSFVVVAMGIGYYKFVQSPEYKKKKAIYERDGF